MAPAYATSFDMQDSSKLPAQVDLSHLFLPPRNQLNIGSCTGESSSYVREALANLQRPGSAVELSPLFVYHQELFLQNALDPVQDVGAPLNVCADVWLQYGACIEADDVYNPAALGETPSESAYANASQYTIQSAYQISTLSEILNCLAKGFPLQIGVLVYPSFESPPVARSGDVQMPSPGEQPLGGHALAVYGYDRTKQVVYFRNSWGSWGNAGNGTLPFAYFQSSNTFMGGFTYRL